MGRDRRPRNCESCEAGFSALWAGPGWALLARVELFQNGTVAEKRIGVLQFALVTAMIL